jgi:hypothetical protein
MKTLPRKWDRAYREKLHRYRKQRLREKLYESEYYDWAERIALSVLIELRPLRPPAPLCWRRQSSNKIFAPPIDGAIL